MNSIKSNCGSRFRAAQPVRRTPTTSGIRLSIGSFLLGSTSRKLDAQAIRPDAPRNDLPAGDWFEEFSVHENCPWRKAAKTRRFPGNLSRATVSNGIEDARTSHPCERGAGLL